MSPCAPLVPHSAVSSPHISQRHSPGQAGAGAGAGTREIKARLQSTRRFISLNNPAPTLESCMQLLALHRGNNTMAPGDCGSHPSIFFLHPLLWVTAARLPGPTRRWDGPGGALCLAQTLAKFYQLSDLMTRIPIKILSHARASKLNICFEFEINISIHLNTQ